jgi:glycosyltransferase involved in cell wall biosynthesis
MKKTCIFIMRNPYIEKVPNVMYWIRYLAAHDYRTVILSSKDAMYPPAEFESEQVCYETPAGCDGPSQRFVSLRLLARALSLARQVRPSFIVGIDALGNVVASVVSRSAGVPHVAFILEYPSPRASRRSVRDRLEAVALRGGHLVVTHDKYHREFLVREVDLVEARIHLLPNGSGPRGYRTPGRYFVDVLGLAPDDKIILHSGGFGPWFCCHELAAAAAQWERSRKLVFHTSHHVDTTPYAVEFRSRGLDKHAVLHSSPVPDSQLDELVGSASIGLATYSLDLLGFRAEYLGLAAGKIGRYLKNGIPVIATNVASIREYVDGYRCGLCVDRFDQLDNAISTILADYGTYRANAFRCYEELWDVEKPCAELTTCLESLKAV